MTPAPIRADRPLAEGVYDIPADRYHADPCPKPSISRSMIVTLLDKSPRHLWLESRRLNPDWQRDDDKKYDKGTAAHAWFLEGRAGVVVIEADDWRTKQAKVLRDRAYANGQTPLLTHQWDEVREMTAAIRPQLDAHQDASNAFSGTRVEVTLIWREGDIWCRCRADAITDDDAFIDDLKTTSGSAHPEAETKRLFNMNADIQSAWYRRGVKAVGLHRNPRFRFISQETHRPYALSVLEFSEEADELANRRIDKALDVWRWCLANDRWPGYPARTCTMSPPVWREKQQMEDEIRDEHLRDAGLDLKKLMLDWQAPLREAKDAI